MKIAIDLNDVVRDFTRNFAIYYKKEFDNNIDLNQIEIKTNNLFAVFPFENKHQYETFVYEDYPWELFGKCATISQNLGSELSNWITKDLKNIDTEEPIDVIVVSTMEYGLTIPATYWFISKANLKVREVYLPMDSYTIWDKCDVLITANPKLLENKPNDKISVKIKADYNIDCPADFTYETIHNLIENIENVQKILEKK